jgi:hypothetical protein
MINQNFMENKIKKSKNVKCVDCHFLAHDEYMTREGGGYNYTKTLSRSKRDNLHQVAPLNTFCSLGFENTANWNAIVDSFIERNPDNCLFYLFERDELSLEAAKVMQKREEDREALNKTLKIASNALNKAEESVKIAKKSYKTSTSLIFLSLMITAGLAISDIAVSIFSTENIPSIYFLIPLAFIFCIGGAFHEGSPLKIEIKKKQKKL